MLSDTATYEEVTRGIRITVVPDFLEEESEPRDDHYVWAYRVRIDNRSDTAVRLSERVWRITDSTGMTVTVTGDGPDGDDTTLRPGEAFEYTSGCPLPTPSGLMSGVHGMITADGERFEAMIPLFSLDSPHDRQRLN